MDEDLKKEIKSLKEKIAFLEAVCRKYVLTGINQFDGYFEDWKKKEGIFR